MNVVCVLLDFSNMAAAAILDFFKFEFQRSVGSRGGNVRHIAKFCQNQSNSCEDIAIYLLFKITAVRHQNLVGIDAVVLTI